jgi:hypothetical protein
MGIWFKNSAIPKLRRDLLTVGKAATDETEQGKWTRPPVFIQESYTC